MSAKKRARSGNPAVRASVVAEWQPMRRGTLNPELVDLAVSAGATPPDEAWGNDRYQCVVREMDSGLTHLSIKRHDRGAVRDWRHMQAIKNDVCGPEREAVELYPAESRLVDTANEYHLWVFPAGVSLPIGYDERLVSSREQMRAWNLAVGGGKGDQREWEPGLSTGGEPNDLPADQMTQRTRG